MDQFTHVAGAEVFADKSFSNTLSYIINICSLTPEAGLTGVWGASAWRNTFLAVEGEGIIINILARFKEKDTEFL